ncbi:hypothetical protein OESDEN_06647 [Oesophagostomum dentatum]|uniref:Uncharacterized protein n=1 Tax=Oesophagostomum dentatum TaxID=61180 RepID=A0A0B1T868_OESDE|nr:hypothetical protein OESDEN_06647 [Oesophagostomum dentatum]
MLRKRCTNCCHTASYDSIILLVCLTLIIQAVMVAVIVLDLMLAIVGFVVLVAQSKTFSRKLGLVNLAVVQEREQEKEGSEEETSMYGPEEEEDPPFGFVGMQRNARRMTKSMAKFVIIPPAVPGQKKKRTEIMRESQLVGRM